jgi:hypothetical protein
MISPRELGTECEQVTRRIAELLGSGTQLSVERVTPVHERYIECIEAVNKRLRHCDELMRKGLRSEAIQASEIQPVLLDLVTELDLPEATAWWEEARSHGLSPPPRLLTNIAAELNRAYADCQSLDDLLRAHRLLALARAPLKDRLALLRKLAAKDDQNPAWREDIKSYEAGRLREIQLELVRVQQQEDVHVACEIDDELHGTAWTLAVPRGISETAQSVRETLVAKNARKRLERIATRLDQAFSAYDLQSATALREEWSESAELAKLAPDDALSLQVSAALDWLDECDRRQANEQKVVVLRAELEEILEDDTATLDEVASRMHALERYDQEIPERLRRRYQQRRELTERAASRRTYGLIAIALALIATVGAVSIYVVNQQLARRELAGIQQSLEKLVKAGEFRKAQQFVDSLQDRSAQALEAPQIQELLVQLEIGAQSERARRDRFLLLRDEVRSTSAAGPTWESVVQAAETVRTIRELAKGEDELLEVEQLAGTIADRRHQLQSEVDREFSDRLREVTAKLGRLDSLDVADIQTLQADAEELAGMTHVSPELLRGSQLGLVSQTLENRKQALMLAEKREVALAAVQHSVGDKLQYIRALREYVERDDGDARADHFQQVLQRDLPFFESVQDWNSLCRRWDDVRLSLASKSVDAPLQLLEQVAQEFSDFPGAHNGDALRAYLREVKQRSSKATDPFTELEKILRQDLFDLQYVVERSTGSQRHYFLGEPEVFGDTIAINALADVLDRNATEAKKFRSVQLVRFENESLYAESPQKRFARRALERLAAKNREPFETIMCDIIQELHEASETDAIFRGGLLQLVVDRAMADSTILAEALSEYREDIDTPEQLNSENWLAPISESNIVALRERVDALLRRVRHTPRQLYEAGVAPRLRAVLGKKPQFHELQWVGMMLRDDAQQWYVHRVPGQTLGRNGQIVVRYFEEAGKSNFRVIGKVDTERNEIVVLPSDDLILIEGALVYLSSGESL